MKPLLFRFLENTFICLFISVIHFQSWKVKEGQYLQPSPNSGPDGLRNLKKYGQVTAQRLSEV